MVADNQLVGDNIALCVWGRPEGFGWLRRFLHYLHNGHGWRFNWVTLLRIRTLDVGQDARLVVFEGRRQRFC